MNRQAALLGVLVGLLVVAASFFFLIKPKMDEVGEVEQQIQSVQDEQLTLRSRIAALEGIRERAPELEASLAGSEAVIPSDPALPAALRQFQLAADESGVTLVSVSASRPSAAEEGLAPIDVTFILDGGYFQIVDFLRRIEDPSISPRAVLWSNLLVSVNEYPTLTATVTGTMFTRAALPPPPEESTEPAVVTTEEPAA